ncbi:hypothetical protein [Kriegella aquimaris]|uniref:Pectate lyase n=1 Tax=Kriegella aquimaris TaxID=192904 RepID=A0A1G9JR80_9FLAO|nr:hypothetical protein [Kriegella aquimaris]SDL39463.1 hypothetical protein SAMN04488514_101655 [Kriegella aquimaris]
MKYLFGNAPKYILVAPFLFFSFSCSNDTDLLAEYVASGSQEIPELNNLVVDDSFVTRLDQSVILDVLSNDMFTTTDNVKIIETSSADNGVVVINDDNTLTYTPIVEDVELDEPETQPQEEDTPSEVVVEEETTETEPSEETTDTFTYTAEVVNEDETVSTEEGTVTVIVTENEEVEVVEDNSENQGDQNKNYGALKAFPTAEGFGKNATGGRGGYVVAVTNLNDSGPGSLRDALKKTGARTIIFKVGGIIDCNSYLEIPYKSGNVTIAGQTAPGGGITIRGAELRISASNVILRYVKIRPGSNVSGSNVNGIRLSSYNNNQIRDIMIDHCSITWATDKVLIIGGIGGTSSVQNVTVQKSIIGENISTGLGFLLWSRATNISVFKNLLIHDVERNIRSSKCTSSFEMINNLVYGFKYGTQPTYNNDFDIIGNVYKTSPNTSTRFETIRLEGSSDCGIGGTRAYISDNVINGRDVSISSNLQPYITNNKIFNSGISSIPSSSVQSAVLNDVGASKYSDRVDERLINDVLNSTGSIKKSVSEAGGYPDISNGTPYQDSDEDGISNEWETAMGLNPNDPSDGNKDRNADGYTNLEDFLNEVDF